MHKNAFLRLHIFNKAKTLGLIEEGNNARSYKVSGVKFSCLGCAYLHIFCSHNPFLITWIRWFRRKIAVLIDISHHFFEGLPFSGLCLALIHLLLLVLALLHLFLVSFFFTYRFSKISHTSNYCLLKCKGPLFIAYIGILGFFSCITGPASRFC